ncbi:hypothetical protein COLO4_26105 [Corchorus olitorius]|uniref:Uncharacterized protein n=1 Tax=Corchorus olitorius TaxID=93759 RepID=A0A1R3HYQ7_9ROSI|nr:hypothetical protein COLO4_26105 [Corchorus olitorius]
MAMTADSSSPRGLSPQFRRTNLPSPWAQVVRGESGESESISVNHSPSSPPPSTASPPVASLPEQTIFSDCSPSKAASSHSSPSSSPPPDNSWAADGGSDSSNNNAAARSKKPAWNKPSNGVVEVSPVMGAASWPALSESARASPKSLADSTPKTVPDGSHSTSQGPVIPQSTQKQGTSNANHNSTHSRTMSGRQRTSKRGGNGGGGDRSEGMSTGILEEATIDHVEMVAIIGMIRTVEVMAVLGMVICSIRDLQGSFKGLLLLVLIILFHHSLWDNL